MRVFLLHIILLLSFLSVKASELVDSLTLSYNDFIANVLVYHPIAKQAQLRQDLGDAEKLNALGNFDPKLSSELREKNFDDKLYYQLFNAKLKIPTPIGVDIVTGYENNIGTYLNAEDKTDKYGLYSVGLEANILNGLLTDERRTALKKAKVFQQMAQNDKQLLLNDLLWDATQAYLKWQNKWQVFLVVKSNVQLAKTYLENTVISYKNGEKAAIDTVEARVNYLDRVSQLQSSELEIISAQQYLENYLWFNDLPVSIKSNISPEDIDNDLFGEINVNRSNDEILVVPALANKRFERDMADLDLRLNRQKVLPKLKLKYNPLLSTSETYTTFNYSTNNYKWGVDFSMPLFVRSERGKIQKSKIKLQSKQLEIQDKENQLLNKVMASKNKQWIIKDQIAVQAQKVESVIRLLDAENEKFRLGESSVFLLNKRLEKNVEAQIKLVNTKTKLNLELLNYLYLTNSIAPVD